MSKVRNAFAAIMLASNATTVINFVASLIIARLLSPADIGLFSMTAVFVGVMHTFRDFGVVSYLLREPDLTPAKVRTANGIMLITSWSMASAMFLLAKPVSAFYQHPQVQEILQVLALGFFFIPFGSVTQALLRRNHEGAKQAQIGVFSTLIYAASCISLAATGFGYMSMAWANLINIITSGALYAMARPDWQPWRPSLQGWRNVVRFGGISALSNLLTNIHTALADTVLAKNVSASAVGLYSRGNALVELFSQVVMPAVNNAALPTLSQSFHNHGRIDHDMLKSSCYLTALAWPVIAATSLLAEDMIRVLYGPTWLPALPLVVWLCIASAARMPFTLGSNALIAIGRPTLAVWTTGLTIALKVGLVLTFSPHDLIDFARLFMLADLIIIVPTLILWQRVLHVAIQAFLRSQLPSMGVAIACYAITLLITTLGQTLNPLLRLLLAALILGPTWLVLIHVTRHPINKEVALVWQKIRNKLLRTKS